MGEILLIDGGSTDKSLEIAKSISGITVLSSPKGRPIQMNFGAKSANFEVLYFLHIDSHPPKNFDALIIQEVKRGNLAGCFRMKFRSQHPWLKFIGWLTRFKLRACRGGDQSQFITKDLFYAIGGYNEEFLIYEDQLLISELYTRKEFVVIPKWLTTSARRFEEVGVFNLQLIFWKVYYMRLKGRSAGEIYKYYQSNFE